MGVSIGIVLGVIVLFGDLLFVDMLVFRTLGRVMVVFIVVVNLGGGSDCCRRYFMGLGSFTKEDKFGFVEWFFFRIFGIFKGFVCLFFFLYCWGFIEFVVIFFCVLVVEYFMCW